MDNSGLPPSRLAACEFGETRILRPEAYRDLERLSIGEGADLALQAAAEDAIAEHARSGVPLVVWQDGRVVELDARKLLADRTAR